MARRPADPEEELRWMSQEVRGYVEAVLNSLAANVPKVHIPASVNIYGFMYLSNFFYCFLCFSGYCALPSRESKGRHA
jgi:hypothetical protein